MFPAQPYVDQYRSCSILSQGTNCCTPRLRLARSDTTKVPQRAKKEEKKCPAQHAAGIKNYRRYLGAPGYWLAVKRNVINHRSVTFLMIRRCDVGSRKLNHRSDRRPKRIKNVGALPVCNRRSDAKKNKRSTFPAVTLHTHRLQKQESPTSKPATT